MMDTRRWDKKIRENPDLKFWAFRGYARRMWQYADKECSRKRYYQCLYRAARSVGNLNAHRPITEFVLMQNFGLLPGHRAK